MLTSDHDVIDFPYLKKEKILNKWKDSLKIGISRFGEEEKEEEIFTEKKLPLHRIPNSELINYF